MLHHQNPPEGKSNISNTLSNSHDLDSSLFNSNLDASLLDANNSALLNTNHLAMVSMNQRLK